MDRITENEMVGTLQMIQQRIEELILGRMRVDTGFSALEAIKVALLLLILWRVW
jgi:hypothetical protein